MSFKFTTSETLRPQRPLRPRRPTRRRPLRPRRPPRLRRKRRITLRATRRNRIGAGSEKSFA